MTALIAALGKRRQPTLLAIVVLLGALNAWPAVSAAQTTEEPPPTGGSTLELVTLPPWIRANEDFFVDLRILGGDPDDTIEIVVYERLESRAEFHLGLGERPIGEPLRSLPPRRLADLPLVDGAVRLILPTANNANSAQAEGKLPLLLPGVYEVVLTLRSDGLLTDELLVHAVRVPDLVFRKVSVATIVPFGIRPGLQPDGSIAFDNQARSDLDRVADALVATTGIPLTLAVTPETIASLALSNDPNDDKLISRLRLTLGEREVLGAPFVPVDANSWVADGLVDNVAAQLATGMDELSNVLGIDIEQTTWLAQPNIRPATIAQLTSLGYADRLVIPESSLDIDDAERFSPTLGQRFRIADSNDVSHDAFVADRAIRLHFDRSDDDLLGAHHLLTDLSVIAMTESSFERGVVVTPPDDWVPSERLLTTLLLELREHPLLTPTTVTDLLTLVSPATLAGDSTDGPPIRRMLLTDGTVEPVGLRSLRTEAADAVAGLSEVLPSNVQVAQNLERLLLVSESSELSTIEQEGYLRSIIDRVALDTNAVSVSVPDRITLSSRSGTLPITIRNSSGLPLRVVLELRGDKLDFPEGSTIELDLEPEVSILEIPIRARTSGDSSLEVTLRSPDGSIALDRFQVTVRSTALSGVGLAIAILAVLALAIWWFRRKRTDQPASNTTRIAPARTGK